MDAHYASPSLTEHLGCLHLRLRNVAPDPPNPADTTYTKACSLQGILLCLLMTGTLNGPPDQ